MVPKPRAPPCFPICAPSALLRGLGASSRFLHRSLHHSIDGPLVHPLLHPRRQNITALSLPSRQPLPPSSLEPPPSRNPTTACPSTYRCDFVSPSDLGRHRLRPPAPTHISTPLSRSRKRRLSVRHLLRPIPGAPVFRGGPSCFTCVIPPHTRISMSRPKRLCQRPAGTVHPLDEAEGHE